MSDPIERIREALAARPTPGPWKIRAERYRFIHVYATGGGICHLDTVDGEGAANAKLIAAASPDNITTLLDRLDAAERECERLRSESKAQLEELYRIDDALGTNEGPSAVDHIMILKTENERLREDAERYRWLRGSAEIPEHSTRWARWEIRRWDGRYWNTIFTEQVDAAIDAARAAEQSDEV